MQLMTVLTAALAATLAAATPTDLNKRGCYGGGEKFGDKRGAALQYAGQWCNGAGSGGFHAGQTKHACYEHDNGNRVEFWLQRRASTGTSLGKDSCNAYLQSQINGCDRGGSGEGDGWYYRVDPNRGSC
ncbi:hypothetical protein BJX61DRAFT_500261 [Aspergillus egyptiacus]|nr:hypothetical protein BJX61DRAFT_500261 [Aspergillus egyptiacus]